MPEHSVSKGESGRLRSRVGALLFTLLLTGCGPLVMLPGGELSGEVEPHPADWSFSRDVETVQLETRPSDPYSVNIWAVDSEGVIYIAAGGGPETTWAQHIAADPNIRLRIGESIFLLRATEANTDADRERFLAAAREKYDFEPSAEDAENAILFRLDPR